MKRQTILLLTAGVLACGLVGCDMGDREKKKETHKTQLAPKKQLTPKELHEQESRIDDLESGDEEP